MTSPVNVEKNIFLGSLEANVFSAKISNSSQAPIVSPNIIKELPEQFSSAGLEKAAKEMSMKSNSIILDHLKIPRQLGNGDDLIKSIETTYPGLELKEKLGKGSYSDAYLFSYQDRLEGTAQKVLKITSISTLYSVSGRNAFEMTKERIGGEWLALLEYNDENVLKTEQALAYDHNKKGFCLVDTTYVQEMFKNPERREKVDLALVGTVSEYIDGSKTLKDKIEKEGPLSSEKIRIYAKQILLGIAAIHQKSVGNEHIIHRDIKPGNILILPDDKVKVFDLGFARLADNKKRRHSILGTPQFMSKELLDQNYNDKVDSYALAVTLFNMVTGKKSSDAKTMGELKVERRNPSFNLGNRVELARIDPDLKDLITRLGTDDPDKRLSVNEALKHPFFKARP